MVKMKGSAMAALQTCYGKKRENKIRNKDQSFACKHQMKNPVWKKILFEMHETSATEYFVSYNYLIRA